MMTNRVCLIVFPTAVLCAFTEPARADYQYLFNTTFSGTGPGAAAPWMDVMFHDTWAGTVSVTISNTDLIGTEFIAGLYLNLRTNLNPTSLTFQLTGGNDPLATPVIFTGVNQFKADGD